MPATVQFAIRALPERKAPATPGTFWLREVALLYPMKESTTVPAFM